MQNSIRVRCPCGKILRAAASLAGKRARCPGCGEHVAIPLSHDTEAPPPVSTKSGVPEAPTETRSQGDRATFDDSSSVRDQSGAAPVPGSLGDRRTYDGGEPFRAVEPGVDQFSLGDRATRAGDETPLPSSRAVPGVVSPASESRLPRVPGYEILELVGHGGMGVVYKARDLKLKRLVALKMVLAGVHASQKQIDRFRGEAEAVARLRNPHIIPIYEIGEADDYPYLALEFADGGSLESRINHRPQPQRKAAVLVRTLAEAIHYCHEQQVVHRDLKPANILLSGGVPKITDFGLAKQLEAETDAAHVATKTGAVLGTPSYMAPEQAKADKGTVGPLADVYALGAILYEMLTGRPPFLGNTPVETIQHVLVREPVAPAVLQPGVSLDLQTICLKCLEKRPHSRYGSARELAEDLQRFLAGEPIHARAIGRAERTWRWCRRHPALAALAGSALMICLLALVLSTTFSKLQTTASTLETATTEREKAQSETVAANRKLSSTVTELQTTASTLEKTTTEREKARLEALAAESATLAAQRNRYFSDIPLALTAHRAGQVERAWQLLSSHWDAPELETSKGWEWRYLLSLTHDGLPLEIPKSHTSYKLSFSGDGQRIAAMLTGPEPSPSKPGPRQLCVWDVASGRIAFTLDNEVFTQWVDHGRILCTVGGVYRNGATGELVSTANLKDECRPSPDGTYIVGATADKQRPNQLGVIETATGRIVASFPDHLTRNGPWSSDGRLWAYVNDKSQDKPDVHVVDVTTGSDRALGILTGRNAASHLAWSPVGPLLAVGGWFIEDKEVGQGIQIWDATSGKLLWRRRINGNSLRAMEWSPDGKRLAVFGELQKEVQIFELDGGDERSIKGNSPLAWSADSRFFATMADRDIVIWEADSLTRVRTIPTLPRGGSEITIYSLNWCPGASLLAGNASLWENASDHKIYFWNAFPHEKILTDIYEPEWHPQNKFLIARLYGKKKHIVLRDYDTGADVASLDCESHGGVSRPLRWSPDGELLAIPTDPGKLLVWNPKSNTVTELTGPKYNNETRHVAWNADGRCIAYEAYGRVLVVADARSGKQLAIPEKARAPFCWHPDGVRLLGLHVEEKRQSLLVWNAATCEHIKSIDYAKGVGEVHWTADGKRIIVQPTDHTEAVFFDYESGQLLTSRSQPPGAVWNNEYTRLFGADARSSHPAMGSPTLWDGASDRGIATLAEKSAEAPAWHPDGTRCAFYTAGRVILVEAESGVVVLELPIPKVKDSNGHEIVLTPRHLSWSPDGERLMAEIYNQPYAIIWDASLGYELQSLRLVREETAPAP